MADLTNHLNASTVGSGEHLFRELYRELQRIARSRLVGERRGQTLDTNCLVHEAWLRLDGTAPEEWRDRKQFYAAASEAMRRILVDSARHRLADKRGGGRFKVNVEDVKLFAQLPDERLVAVHEVLDQLEAENELNARIVKLRFFGGMRHQEIAALLELSETTVRRHWSVAKVWLFRALQEEYGE